MRPDGVLHGPRDLADRCARAARTCPGGAGARRSVSPGSSVGSASQPGSRPSGRPVIVGRLLATPRPDGTDGRWTGTPGPLPSDGDDVRPAVDLDPHRRRARAARRRGRVARRAGAPSTSGDPRTGTSNVIALAAGVFLGVELTRALGRLQARAGMGATVDAMLPLVVGLGAAFVLAGSHRRRRAGWLVVGLAAPWTLLAAVVCHRAGRAGPTSRRSPRSPGSWRAPCPCSSGSCSRAWMSTPEPDAFAAAGRPGSRRPGSLTAALARRTRYGPVGSGAHPGDARDRRRSRPSARGCRSWCRWRSSRRASSRASSWSSRAIPPAVRRALEAYHWIGRAAIARLERLSGRPMPRSRPAMARWLEAPETDADRAFRPELLAYPGPDGRGPRGAGAAGARPRPWSASTTRRPPGSWSGG